MKIKDIVENTVYKVVKSDPTSGTDLQSSDMHTTLHLDPQASKGIVADPSDPKKFTMQDPAKMADSSAPTGPQAGADVEVPATEEYDDDDSSNHYSDWMNSEHSPSIGDDKDVVYNKAIHYLHSSGMHPGDIEYHAHHMSKRFDENHGDVGGDATDQFINNVQVKPHVPGSYQAEANFYGSKTELEHMLSIAGLK